MGKLSIKRRPSRSPQVGDMRNRIVIAKRDIKPPSFGSASFSEEYTTIATVWASVFTLTGNQLFSGVDTNTKVSHLFKIRYRPVSADFPLPFPVGFEYVSEEILSGYIIIFKDNHYKIVNVENPENRNRFFDIYTDLLGSESLEANQ